MAYARLLDEAKVRLSAIEGLIDGRFGLPQPIIAELGFLQLRMLCEVVALCCLVAHGDLEATRTSKLQKTYLADNIFGRLEQLHPNFYPRPVNVSPIEGGHHADPITEGFLTKGELLKLYHECGDRLHRGSLSRFLSSAPHVHTADLDRVRGWFNKFITLLRSHHVASHNNLAHLICFLSHEQVKGKALVILAQSPLPE